MLNQLLNEIVPVLVSEHGLKTLSFQELVNANCAQYFILVVVVAWKELGSPWDKQTLKKFASGLVRAQNSDVRL